MAAISTIIAGAALAVGTGTAIASSKQASKANDAAEESRRLNRADVNAQELASARQTNRESRIARAKALQLGVSTGTEFSSKTSAQTSSIGTQSASLFSGVENKASLQNAQITQQTIQADASRRSNDLTALSNLSFQVFGQALGGNLDFLNSKTPTTPTPKGP